jgi:hypothetical protein
MSVLEALPLAGGVNHGDYAYQKVEIYNADQSVRWTVVDKWGGYGLGYASPRPLQWIQGERYLYIADTGNADGCGDQFWLDLRKIDLTDGSVEDLDLGTYGFPSPDGTATAQRRGNTVVARELQTGAERVFEFEVGFEVPDVRYVEDITWSPDSTVLTFSVTNESCTLPPVTVQVDIVASTVTVH